MELIRYEAAKQALAEYHTVDEVKDFRDKALAIEAYARQACDYELEKDAARARVRAERRAGELLKELEKNTGAKGVGPIAVDDYDRNNKTLSEMGITKDQSSTWQKAADIPEEEFEQAVDANLDASGRVSTRNIVKSKTEKQEPVEQIDDNVLWWWGRLQAMEREHFHMTLAEVIEKTPAHMREEFDELIPKLKGWLDAYHG